MGEATKVGSIAELEAMVGKELGPTGWKSIDQARVDSFAETTEDHQWIHVEELIDFGGFAHVLNYGYGKVRFPSATPVGTRLRMRLKIGAVEPAPGGVQATLIQTFEMEGGEKPACVAEALARVYEG
jgi:acyl dehydratase